MNILLQFAFGFFYFGRRYMSNRGWLCIIYMSKMVNRVRRRGVCLTRFVHASSACPCQTCVGSGEAGDFPHVQAS